MNVATISTVSSATQAAVESITSNNNKHQTTYKIEMLDDSMASDDDDDDLISSDGSMFDENELAQIAVQDDLANQLAAAGPVGVAAAAAIASSKKRKRQHSFETNPSVRKRQQNRLLRKLRGIIYEFTGRVGKQAVVLVATPGKPNTSYKVFGAKPLEDVVRNLKNIVMDELENALAQQAPPPPQEDPSLFELPPLIIDGIPTPVEKMTQAQLRAFIPLMLKYSTGRGKPGWGREATRPPWWPKELPWANVRMDARSEDDKQKISWTHALRKIVINCYKYHGREDLLPTFADEDEKVAQLISHEEEEEEEEEEVLIQPVSHNTGTTIQTIQTQNNASSNVRYTTQTVLSTIQNADGTVSLIQVDPNNPIITLPDGTTAQVQGVATLHQGEGGATIQTVQSLADVNSHENMTVDLTEATVAQDGQIYITAEDGQGYPVSVSNMITVPVSASMYQSMMANIQQIHTNSDGTVCITPMQVDAQQQQQHHHHNTNITNTNNNNNNNNNTNTNTNNNTNTNSNNNCNHNNDGSNCNNSGGCNIATPQYQCYSIVAPFGGSAAAAAAHRLLTNSALGQTQNLVQNLNLSNCSATNNNNNNSNSGSSSSSRRNDSGGGGGHNHNHRSSDNSGSSGSGNHSCSSTNQNQNIRCQIINASSLVANNSSHHLNNNNNNNNNNNSSSSSSCCIPQQQQHQFSATSFPAHTFLSPQSLTNVLQNAAAKVFLTANPGHLSLTAAATNILNNNNNNNNINCDTTNNIGHIKIASLPIVVATNTNTNPATFIAAAAAAATGGSKHRRRFSAINNSSNNNNKSNHKRRKHTTTINTNAASATTIAAKVIPMKIEAEEDEEEGVVDITSATNMMQQQKHNNDNNNDNSNNTSNDVTDINDSNISNNTSATNTATTATAAVSTNAEGLLNIQIVNTSIDNNNEASIDAKVVGGVDVHSMVEAEGSANVGMGVDVSGACIATIGNVRVSGNRLLSIDVSNATGSVASHHLNAKAVKLETIADN